MQIMSMVGMVGEGWSANKKKERKFISDIFRKEERKEKEKEAVIPG